MTDDETTSTPESDLQGGSGTTGGPTGLPAEDPVAVEETVVDLTVERPDARDRAVKAGAGAGLLGALVVLMVRFLRGRRQPTPSERLADTTRSLGADVVGAGTRTLRSLGSTAAPVAERTGELAVHGARAGLDVVSRGTAVAVPVVVGAAGAAGHVGQQLGHGIAEVPGVVTGAAADVGAFWGKWTRRVLHSTALAIGYVLGARAGRERYEQIASAARGVAGRPEVQRATAKVQDTVRQQTGS